MEAAERAVETLEGPAGREVVDAAVGALLESHVAQELPTESVDVEQVRRGGGEHLPVPHPRRALALGAVGGYVADVVAHRPHHGLVQPVQPVVAALEPTRTAKVGVHDDARDVVNSERAGVALDGDVPEALGRQPWLEDVTDAAA